MDRFIESLPKTETHLHIEGAIPWELFHERFPGEFEEVPKFQEPDFRYDNFRQFEEILIDHALRIIKTPEDYAEIAQKVFARLLAQNVAYVETSFHSGIIEFIGLDGEESREGVEPLRHNFSSRLPSDNCNAELRPKLARYFFNNNK